MKATLVTVVLSAVVLDSVSASCSGQDHPSCAAWIADDFCSSTRIADAMKKRYCGVGCGLCDEQGKELVAAEPLPCVDNHYMCPDWAALGFCASTQYSQEQKMSKCCASCSAPPPPPAPVTTASPLLPADYLTDIIDLHYSGDADEVTQPAQKNHEVEKDEDTSDEDISEPRRFWE